MRGVFLINPEMKRPRGRSRHRWKDNIKMHLREVKCECVDWIQIAQDIVQWQALVNVGINVCIL